MAPNRRARPATPANRRSLPLVPVVVGLVVLAAVVAALLSAGGDDDTETGTDAGLEQTRPVTVTGDALPPLGEGPDPAVGAVAPEVRGAGFDGEPVSITHDGTPKLLVFLAHWCPHCQREVPVIVDWLEERGRPDGVDVYAIATGTSPDRPNYPPSEWLAREGLDVPTLADDEEGTAANAFGLTAYPYFVVLDGEGRVVVRGSGELGPDQLDALVEAARSGG